MLDDIYLVGEYNDGAMTFTAFTEIEDAERLFELKEQRDPGGNYFLTSVPCHDSFDAAFEELAIDEDAITFDDDEEDEAGPDES